MRPQFGGSRAVRARPVLKNPHIDASYASAGLQYRCCAPITRFAAVPARAPTRLHRIAAAAQREVAEGIRINKCFKASHSRRQADVLIESRRVMLNGKVSSAQLLRTWYAAGLGTMSSTQFCTQSKAKSQM